MDRCRYRGGSDPERSLIICSEAVDGRKREDPSPFLMGGGGLPGGHGAATLLFILCYNKGNATWAAVASKEGKDET